MVAIGAAAAGFVQGLSGFPFALVSISIWAWFLDPKLISTLAVFGAFTRQAIAAVTTRRGFHMARLLPFLLGGFCGIPMGVIVLPMLDPLLFKFGLGLLLVLYCPVMLFSARIPVVHAGGRAADALVGMSGGMLGAIAGLSGTLPTVWCTLRGLEKDPQRNIIQNFNLAMLGVTFCVYLWRGMVSAPMLPYLATVGLAAAAPVLLGSRLYTGMSERAFRRLVLSLLMVLGVALLVASVPHVWSRVAGA